MAKACSDAYMDAMLALIDNATTLTVCSGQPANFAGIAAVALASVTLTAGAGNGDYTIGNGDTSGRKLTIAQQADIDITTSGTATHVVLDDGTNIYVTTCTSQALTDTGTVTVPAWDIEISDPS
jgi:hypothetical protein